MGHDSHQSTANWLRVFLSLCVSVIEMRDGAECFGCEVSRTCRWVGEIAPFMLKAVLSSQPFSSSHGQLWLCLRCLSLVKFTRLGTPSRGVSRTVIPLLCVVHFNCNAIWTLEFPVWPVPSSPTFGCRRFMWALRRAVGNTHSQHTHAQTRTQQPLSWQKWEAYIFPNIEECVCREETESGL